MDITKVLEMLGVDKIDESKQSEITETLTTIIEAKAQEMANNKVEESLVLEKEKLVEEFETKFEDYKEDVTSKFSNFVDSILEEEMVIPEKIVKYARLGELYEDLIDQFKVRLAIDEGLLDSEVKGMLKEAKSEIQSLRDNVNELTGTKLQLEQDAKEMATHIFLRKKCDGLTESQKTAVMNILEGSNQDDIDKKFDIVLESLGSTEGDNLNEDTQLNENEKKMITEMGDDEKEKYMGMGDDEKKAYYEKYTKGMSESEKTSTTEVSEQQKQQMNESENSMMNHWKKMIREGRI